MLTEKLTLGLLLCQRWEKGGGSIIKSGGGGDGMLNALAVAVATFTHVFMATDGSIGSD